MSASPEKVIEEVVIKIDLGCGKNKMAGFSGVDSIAFDDVDHVFNMGKDKWPWGDGTVSEAHSSHAVEHLDATERLHFWHELYRVLKKGAQARIVTPHWSNACAYGDLSHKWPPMSEWYAYYLNKGWRDVNAPHIPLDPVDFDFVVGGSWDGWLEVRNMDTRVFAMSRYINSYRDLIVTLTKK
jgi:hypothetical protein